MDSIYPVGSLYFSTASTCPLESLGFGTWNKVGTSLTLNVDTNVPVMGNGMALGLYNNKQGYGLVGWDGYNESYSHTVASSNKAYGKSAGTQINQVYANFQTTQALGVTNDASKSGIVGTVIRTQLTVNIFQRTE